MIVVILLGVLLLVTHGCYPAQHQYLFVTRYVACLCLLRWDPGDNTFSGKRAISAESSAAAEKAPVGVVLVKVSLRDSGFSHGLTSDEAKVEVCP
jgi:hypothetical protein